VETEKPIRDTDFRGSSLESRVEWKPKGARRKEGRSFEISLSLSRQSCGNSVVVGLETVVSKEIVAKRSVYPEGG